MNDRRTMLDARGPLRRSAGGLFGGALMALSVTLVPEPAAAPIVLGLEALRDADPAELGLAARKAAEPFTYTSQAQAFASLYRLLKR